MFEFRLKFHWNSFLRLQLPSLQHWFRWWLGAVQATSHDLKQWWLIHWRINASLGLNELMARKRHDTKHSYQTNSRFTLDTLQILSMTWIMTGKIWEITLDVQNTYISRNGSIAPNHVVITSLCIISFSLESARISSKVFGNAKCSIQRNVEERIKLKTCSYISKVALKVYQKI